MNPELQFLLDCCRSFPSPELIASIRSQLVSADSAWLMTTGQLAHNHGVFPLFFKSLNEHAADLIAQEIMTELERQYLGIVQYNMLLSAELISIMKLLAENNLAALAFKGPTLARLAYGDITLRQYGDLDILVQKKDIRQVDSLLKAHGYQRALRLMPFQEKIWFERAHDLALHHPDKDIYLEMHWSLMDEKYPIQLELAEVWDNPYPVIINQQPLNTFAHEELLIYLLIHGSKHLWERIEWIKDIDLLVQSRELDWKKILGKVRGSDFEKMFFLGLYLADRFFATEFPTIVTERMAIYMKLPNLSDAIIEKKWSGRNPGGLTHTLGLTCIKLKLFPGWKKRLLCLHNILIKPTFNEYWLIDLPRSLYWLYYLIRPCMLTIKYLKKWGLAPRR